MGLIDRYLGRSALSRTERLIAAKLDEIAQAQTLQTEHQQSVQKRIDKVDVEIVALRKTRKLIASEMISIRLRDDQRIEQLKAELAELRANEAALQKPGPNEPKLSDQITN